jgi:hypothetical protein
VAGQAEKTNPELIFLRGLQTVILVAAEETSVVVPPRQYQLMTKAFRVTEQSALSGPEILAHSHPLTLAHLEENADVY